MNAKEYEEHVLTIFRSQFDTVVYEKDEVSRKGKTYKNFLLTKEDLIPTYDSARAQQRNRPSGFFKGKIDIRISFDPSSTETGNMIIRKAYFNGAPGKLVVARELGDDTDEFYEPKKPENLNGLYRNGNWTSKKDYDHFCYYDKWVRTYQFKDILTSVKRSFTKEFNVDTKKLRNDESVKAQIEREESKFKKFVEMKRMNLLNELNEELATYAPDAYEHGYRFRIEDFGNRTEFLKHPTAYYEIKLNFDIRKEIGDQTGNYRSSSNLHGFVKFKHNGENQMDMTWDETLSIDGAFHSAVNGFRYFRTETNSQELSIGIHRPDYTLREKATEEQKAEWRRVVMKTANDLFKKAIILTDLSDSVDVETKQIFAQVRKFAQKAHLM